MIIKSLVNKRSDYNAYNTFYFIPINFPFFYWQIHSENHTVVKCERLTILSSLKVKTKTRREM